MIAVNVRFLGVALVLATGCSAREGSVRESAAREVLEESATSKRESGILDPLTYNPGMGPTVADGVDGLVEYDGNCIYVRSGATRFLVFWPEQAVRVDSNRIVFGGRKLENGSKVSLTGTASYARPRDQWPTDRREGCDYTNTFAIAGGRLKP